MYFLGTQSADKDIEPTSELVRRSMIIAKSRSSISIDTRLSLVELHETDEVIANNPLARSKTMHHHHGINNSVVSDSFREYQHSPLSH